MNYRQHQSQRIWKHLISAPLIWLPFFPILLLDILVTIYQAICFPIYKIEKVNRDTYILIMDRAKLEYLSPLEKVSCMYCGYVNGFLLYAKEIAGRTEKYWCGVMHESKQGFKVQPSQIEEDFAIYGDEADCTNKYGLLK